MFATFRRIKLQPGKAGEVAKLIESEYLPQLDDLEGFLSYTLVYLGEDEISSIGVFTTPESAGHANTAAEAWTKERLGPFVSSPLEARAGSVLVDFRAGS